jgi:hypothetical protein
MEFNIKLVHSPTSFVSLPPLVLQSLFGKRPPPLPLILELTSLEGKGNVQPWSAVDFGEQGGGKKWHVAWAGAASMGNELEVRDDFCAIWISSLRLEVLRFERLFAWWCSDCVFKSLID